MSGSNKITLLFLLIGFAFCHSPVDAQIYSNNDDFTKPASYPVYNSSDQIFVFYQANGVFKPGSLSTSGIGAGTFDFVWTKYDFNTDDFTVPIKTDNGASTSTINGLNEGGYRVQITNGVDVDTFFTGWVMLDNLLVEIEKTADGMVKGFKSGCSDGNYLTVDGIVVADTFQYYDLSTHNPVKLINGYTFEWTSDNAELTIAGATRFLNNSTSDPPVEDTYYILTASDSLGMTEVDSVFYDTKFTRAEFTVEYYNKKYDPVNPDGKEPWRDDLTESWSLDDGSLDAPLTVRFLNESKNGAEFTWVFLDTINEVTKDGTKEYETVTDMDYQPEYTYYNADKYYYPYLVSVSDVGCVDTFKMDDGIRVVRSDLSVPNVFSPNGDENNDIWLFKHQSIKEFKLTIINKFGRVVYRQHIEDIYSWEGWRGTILNTDTPAPEGQYYYIVEGLGYDNVEFMDPTNRERRKLERQSGGSTPPTGTEPGGTSQSTIFTGWLYLFRTSGTF